MDDAVVAQQMRDAPLTGPEWADHPPVPLVRREESSSGQVGGLTSTIFYDGVAKPVWGGEDDYIQPEIITVIPDWRENDVDEDEEGADKEDMSHRLQEVVKNKRSDGWLPDDDETSDNQSLKEREDEPSDSRKQEDMENETSDSQNLVDEEDETLDHQNQVDEKDEASDSQNQVDEEDETTENQNQVDEEESHDSQNLVDEEEDKTSESQGEVDLEDETPHRQSLADEETGSNRLYQGDEYDGRPIVFHSRREKSYRDIDLEETVSIGPLSRNDEDANSSGVEEEIEDADDYMASDEITLEPDLLEDTMRISTNGLDGIASPDQEGRKERDAKYILQGLSCSQQQLLPPASGSVLGQQGDQHHESNRDGDNRTWKLEITSEPVFIETTAFAKETDPAVEIVSTEKTATNRKTAVADETEKNQETALAEETAILEETDTSTIGVTTISREMSTMEETAPADKSDGGKGNIFPHLVLVRSQLAVHQDLTNMAVSLDQNQDGRPHGDQSKADQLKQNEMTTSATILVDQSQLGSGDTSVLQQLNDEKKAGVILEEGEEESQVAAGATQPPRAQPLQVLQVHRSREASNQVNERQKDDRPHNAGGVFLDLEASTGNQEPSEVAEAARPEHGLLEPPVRREHELQEELPRQEHGLLEEPILRGKDSLVKEPARWEQGLEELPRQEHSLLEEPPRQQHVLLEEPILRGKDSLVKEPARWERGLLEQPPQRERVFLPAGHGLQFGLTLGHLDKAEKLKLEIFSKSSPFKLDTEYF
jgi:hypothetical protein